MSIQVECLQCSKTFMKKVADIKRSKNHFCSRSCSASYNNKTHPKKQRSGAKCVDCNLPIRKNCSRCQRCRTLYVNNLIDDCTLEECIYANHYRSSAYAKVRTRARAVAQKLGWKKCSVCGYDKHIEVDHIKPISSFDPSTKMSIINDPSNLRPLCPNCHWETHNMS